MCPAADQREQRNRRQALARRARSRCCSPATPRAASTTQTSRGGDHLHRHAPGNVTGAFADPTHELAFAAQFFRLCFPCHVLLLAFPIATAMLTALTARGLTPDMQAFQSMTASFATLGLIGRVLVHRIADTVSGQRKGLWAWTAVMVVSVLADIVGYAVAPTSTCRAVITYYSNINPSGYTIPHEDAPLSGAWHVLWGPTGTPWGRAEGCNM